MSSTVIIIDLLTIIEVYHGTRSIQSSINRAIDTGSMQAAGSSSIQS